VERTRAGLEVVRFSEGEATLTLGRVGGRKMTDSKLESARRLLAGGVPVKDVPTLYRWLPVSS
jgi:hypothetical protein